jgi:hypothetical protein
MLRPQLRPAATLIRFELASTQALTKVHCQRYQSVEAPINYKIVGKSMCFQ